MKLGTIIEMADGRRGTVVFNSLIGVGVKWGEHRLDPKDFEGTTGNIVSADPPAHWPWSPDALLREPWDTCGAYGFSAEECVGENYTIVSIPGEGV